MKELSIEEKAKRYDELKVTAQELEHDGCFDKITLFDLFPELKESEDERIRKGLIALLKFGLEDGSVIAPGFNETKEQALAWLEKQGKKELVTCPICGWEIEKQGEQKPAWSEEDEKIYQSIMDDTVQENQLDDKQTNWLRDIKYRYFPQPKQEWSEEDEINYNYALAACIYYGEVKGYTDTETHQKTIDWLKSLKLQKQWKPSEEQINALDNARHSNPFNVHILDTLFHDLKKLTE